MQTDQERQNDEILVISSIYDCTEFTCNKKDKFQCQFNIFHTFNEKQLEIRYTDQNDDISTPMKYFVQHLPPIRFYVEFPYDYPSKNPPSFYLNISWLPPWETSFVCQKLDEIWQQNKGNEVLLLWLDFLKNDVFNLLKIFRILDISFLYLLHIIPVECIKTNLMSLCDHRSLNRILFLNPIEILTNYDKLQHKIEFDKSIYDCHICFETYVGQKCVKLQTCNHIYCKACMKQYITIKITEGAVKSIKCPDSSCTSSIIDSEIKYICPNLFLQYEKLLLQVTLDSMSDVTFCPRITCQYPIIKDADESLATCSNCKYCFCIYCRKVYHGVTPCEMVLEDMHKLIEEYKNSNKQQNTILEQKYGRKQIQKIVEKYLSDEYIKNNTKICPKCQTLIEKIDGCNKMICSHCQASFCWLCGIHIVTKNTYSHFLNNDSICYGRLFEGLLDNEDYIDFIED